MNYSEFTTTIAEKAKKATGNECSVSINRVIKNNDIRLDGLVIMQKDRFIAPTIYLNDYYYKLKKTLRENKDFERFINDELFQWNIRYK